VEASRARRAVWIWAVASLLLTSSVHAQDAARRDGNWWRGLSGDLDTEEGRRNFFTKTWYITGLLDGTFGLSRDLLILALSESGDLTFGERVEGAYSRARDKRVVNVGLGQVYDGVTTFYQDFRNRRILVALAITIVLEQIAGVPPAQVETAIEALRQRAGPTP